MKTFEELWLMHKQNLYQYLVVCARQRADADDLLQTVACEASKSFPKLRNRERFTAWLMRIARRVVADYYTEMNKLPYCEANPNKLAELARMADCYVRDFSDDVLATAVITDFILRLDEPWASAYYLYYFMGIPIRELSVMVNKTHMATYKHMYRLTQELKKRLKGGDER